MEKINIHESYKEFIAPYPVYETYNEAKKYVPSKGYEIHHIVPVATQEGYSKEKWRKKPQDDRCIILTTLNHIFAHYLYCRDYPEENSQFIALNNMCRERGIELLEDEKQFLERLPYFAEMREKGRPCGEKNGMYGKQHSEEWRIKHSEAMKGKNHPLYGKTPSEETRKKISEANKGKTPSEETRKKLSESRKGEKNHRYGKTPSEETRKKISEAESKKVYHRDLEGNVIHIFNSSKLLRETLGISKTTMHKYLHGQTPKNLTYTLSYN
jgi:hypothetical protein